MEKYRGMGYLRRKLNNKRIRVAVRYRYYEMKNANRDFNIIIPKEFKCFNEVLGW